jgi:hypothetical protein
MILIILIALLVPTTGGLNLFGYASTYHQLSETFQDQHQISYYFTDYDPAVSFLQYPENMVDQNLSTHATPIIIMRDSQIQTSNTCTGTDLGDILKVEIGAYGYLAGIGFTIHVDMKPIFDDIESDQLYTKTFVSNLSWVWSFVDITSDPYAPDHWTWDDIKNLAMNITSRGISAEDYFSCAETVVRVTYSKENYPPSVTIKDPKDNQTVKGEINISGDATDPNGIDDLDYIMIHTENMGWEYASGTYNWMHTWNTTLVDDGHYLISAIAVDKHGRQSAPYTIDIQVGNRNKHPTVSIENPQNNTELSDIIQISGTANDTDGTINRVELRFDANEWVRANGTNNWYYIWDTTTLMNKKYWIDVRSFDGEFYSNVSSITVTVNNSVNLSCNQLKGGFGISAEISNEGPTMVEGLSWMILIEPDPIGFIISEREMTGIIDELDVGESTTIQATDIRGIGPVNIQIQIAEYRTDASGFLLGPLILRIHEV